MRKQYHSAAVRVLAVATILYGLSVSIPRLYASGFEIMERSAEGIGKSFAGATAGLSDGSSTYFNPATLSIFDQQLLNAGAHIILPRTEFENKGSRFADGSLIPDSDGGDGGVVPVVPSVYYVFPWVEDVALGLSVNTPFGLATEWNHDWVGRYHGVNSDLLSLNISPAISWSVHDRLALGASLSIMYLEAELSNAINLGTIAAMQLPPPANAAFAPGSSDGFASVKGDDWGYGYTLGLLAEPWQSGRIGLSYRSKIDATLEGSVDFTVPAALQPAFQPMGLFVDGPASADLTLPERVNLGYIHQVTEDLQVAFETAWTRWSRFEELRVEFDSNQPDSVTEENWDDTWMCALGFDYRCSDTFTFRSGAAYDQSPIPDPVHRTPRIPGNDRLWLSVGCGIKALDNLVVDLAYAHIFVDNDAPTAAVSSTGDTLIGEFDAEVDILSLQAVLKF